MKADIVFACFPGSHDTVEGFLTRSLVNRTVWLLGLPILFGLEIHQAIALPTHSGPHIQALVTVLAIAGLLIMWVNYPLAQAGSVQDILQDSDSFQPQLERLLNHHPEEHPISLQIYRLPFPHLCQIYHLLNPRHLTTVHKLSLGHFKIGHETQLISTEAGGSLSFQTTLDTPLNLLRLWRRVQATAELVLQSPYQVKLNVPSHQGGVITLVFTAVPAGPWEHIFAVQIFGKLYWPQCLWRLAFLFITMITVLEDLAYLRHLSKRNWLNVQQLAKSNQHESLRLFQRYLQLYQNSIFMAK